MSSKYVSPLADQMPMRPDVSRVVDASFALIENVFGSAVPSGQKRARIDVVLSASSTCTRNWYHLFTSGVNAESVMPLGFAAPNDMTCIVSFVVVPCGHVPIR